MKKLSALTDEMLVELYAQGNNEAFDTLLNRYESKVFTFISNFVPTREVAEDIFQDVFMKLVANIRRGQYTERQKFGSWLMCVTRNMLIDHHRREKKMPYISNEGDNIEFINSPSIVDENNIEYTLVSDQNLHDLQSIIAMLPQNQQDIIRMRFYEDMQFKDIAKACNISINTALGRVRYAILNLKKLAAKYNVTMM